MQKTEMMNPIDNSATLHHFLKHELNELPKEEIPAAIDQCQRLQGNVQRELNKLTEKANRLRVAIRTAGLKRYQVISILRRNALRKEMAAHRRALLACQSQREGQEELLMLCQAALARLTSS